MISFTKKLTELNREHSILDQPVAERLESKYPFFEHAFLPSAGEAPIPGLPELSRDTKVIAFIPLDDSPQARGSVKGALSGIISSAADKTVVDMDIAAPYTELLGGKDSEGVSDHFLYGVSLERTLLPSPTDPKCKILN
ncbi:MAG: hypothetical protein U9N45_02305, partial [Gemmatimonadota bacterium]|nr:hypothetical protein [Gemmatimonadota bacterium]